MTTPEPTTDNLAKPRDLYGQDSEPTIEITAAQLAEERQRMAATGTGYVPHWHELTDREREQATAEADRWLTAMRNVTNRQPSRD